MVAPLLYSIVATMCGHVAMWQHKVNNCQLTTSQQQPMLSLLLTLTHAATAVASVLVLNCFRLVRLRQCKKLDMMRATTASHLLCFCTVLWGVVAAVATAFDHTKSNITVCGIIVQTLRSYRAIRDMDVCAWCETQS